MRHLVLAALFALALPATLAIAHSPNLNSDCSAAAGPDDTLEVLEVRARLDLPLATLYVGEDGHVYQETNGLDGLQTHAHVCTAKDGKARVWMDVPPDHRLL